MTFRFPVRIKSEVGFLNEDDMRKLPSWAQLLSDAVSGQPDPVPEGYKTISEWSDEYKKGKATTGEVLRRLVKSGKWQKITLNAKSGNRLTKVGFFRPKQ